VTDTILLNGRIATLDPAISLTARAPPGVRGHAQLLAALRVSESSKPWTVGA
jgi:hypothetical protein